MHFGDTPTFIFIEHLRLACRCGPASAVLTSFPETNPSRLGFLPLSRLLSVRSGETKSWRVHCRPGDRAGPSGGGPGVGEPHLGPPTPPPQGLAGLRFVFCSVSAACSVSLPRILGSGQCVGRASQAWCPSMGQTFWKVLPPTWLWVKVQAPCREVLAEFFPLRLGLGSQETPIRHTGCCPVPWQPPARALGLTARSCWLPHPLWVSGFLPGPRGRVQVRHGNPLLRTLHL